LEHSFTSGGRRGFLIKGCSVALAVAAGDTWLRAEQPATLDVAYAGSMGSMMEGPIKTAAAATLIWRCMAALKDRAHWHS
jgi:hypothetical protein